MMLTPEQLLACMPRLRQASLWAPELNVAMREFAITTPERAAAFLAQIAHESAECSRLVENLNYSARRLTQVWPRRFPTLHVAEPYAHLPERLANHVYANRLGNGPEASGDGWRFRGRGLIQLTGRANYRACGKALGPDLEASPHYLEDRMWASLAAAWFWSTRGCNELADCQPGDDDDEDFVRITKIINGGTHGLADRRRYWRLACAALRGEVIAEPVRPAA